MKVSIVLPPLKFYNIIVIYLQNKERQLFVFKRRPMVINILMNDGKKKIVSPAYKCVYTTLVNGNGLKQCAPVNGEIVLRNGSNKIRAKSPELYEWLQNGWKQNN
ncbi:hypothetical protein [Paenibacillus sp. LPE1-1-1.1]|uniref:hypothetical protein n=1 Tax=Paenibacillus sp. LPE1-1-1.1 TaxID=3135230 RepID=UPI00342B1231